MNTRPHRACISSRRKGLKRILCDIVFDGDHAQEWINFIEELVPKVAEMDDEVPPLPPKDVIHRIYRDVCRLASLGFFC